MKVCVFGLRGFPLVEGGVEKHCEYLYPRIDGDIDFVVYRRKTYVRGNGNYKHITFVDLPSTRIRGWETLIYSFLATIHTLKERPDVVHIHNIGPALFSGLISRKGIPIVLTYHSPNYEHKKWGRFARRLLLKSEQIALKNASKIIFVNKFQKEKYPKEIQDKAVYIPNGVNDPIISKRTDFLEEIGVEPRKYVLSVGRITPEKGFDTLIKAFTKCKHDGYKLVIAGGAEFEKAYMERLRNLGNPDVIFTGYIWGDKLAQVYSNAALYVLASRNEGFPMVLLEAMSYGLRVLASDIPGTHLVNLEDDDYFPVDDEYSLAEKLSNQFCAPQYRVYNMSEFSWDTVATKVTKVYREILS